MSGGSPTAAAATGGSDALTDRCRARAPRPPPPGGHVPRGGAGAEGGWGPRPEAAAAGGPARGASEGRPNINVFLVFSAAR